MYTRHLTITSALGFYIRSLRFFPFETCSSDGITFFQTIGARISFTIFQISYACRLYIFRRHSKRVVHYKKTMLTKQNQRCEACLRFSIRAIAHSLTRSFIRSFCHSDCVQIWACTEWLNVCTGCVRHSVCSGMTPKYPCLVSLCLCVCVFMCSVVPWKKENMMKIHRYLVVLLLKPLLLLPLFVRRCYTLVASNSSRPQM